MLFLIKLQHVPLRLHLPDPCLNDVFLRLLPLVKEALTSWQDICGTHFKSNQVCIFIFQAVQHGSSVHFCKESTASSVSPLECHPLVE